MPYTLNSTLKADMLARSRRLLSSPRANHFPLHHLLKVNKNANFFKFDILTRTDLWGTPCRTRNDFDFDRIDSRYETRLIDRTSRIRLSRLSCRFQSVVSA